MRQVLIPDFEDRSSHSISLQPSWLDLPGICARLVGRDPHEAIGIATSWGLIYLAAHIMDSVEDDDPLISCLENCGSGQAINLATGLYATSELILSDMPKDGIPSGVINDIRNDFHRTILEMCSAQHVELTSGDLDLEQCWRIAEAKSGAFFALACRSGARLGTEDPSTLTGFHEFGRHLGILIQISDDAKEIWGDGQWQSMSLKAGLCNLPIQYALSVCSDEESRRIRRTLSSSPKTPGSLQQMRAILEFAGAPMYIGTKAEQHRRLAQKAFERSGLHLPAGNELANMLAQVSLSIEQ